MNISQEQQNHIKGLIVTGRKIEAISYVRQEFNVSLREAKRLVDDLDDQVGDQTKAMVGRVMKGKSFMGGCIGFFFGFIGLALIGGAIAVAVYNQQLASNGVLVTATVVDDPYQPTFEYELYGQVYEYYSSTYTDPPSYSLGEKVEMYVNPTDPQDVLVNTFSDRWLATTILGIMGLIFAGVGFGVGRLMRK